MRRWRNPILRCGVRDVWRRLSGIPPRPGSAVVSVTFSAPGEILRAASSATGRRQSVDYGRESWLSTTMHSGESFSRSWARSSSPSARARIRCISPGRLCRRARLGSVHSFHSSPSGRVGHPGAERPRDRARGGTRGRPQGPASVAKHHQRTGSPGGYRRGLGRYRVANAALRVLQLDAAYPGCGVDRDRRVDTGGRRRRSRQGNSRSGGIRGAVAGRVAVCGVRVPGVDKHPSRRDLRRRGRPPSGGGRPRLPGPPSRRVVHAGRGHVRGPFSASIRRGVRGRHG